MGESRSLQDLSLKISYRTGRDDLVRDFFVPRLEASGLYRRAAAAPPTPSAQARSARSRPSPAFWASSMASRVRDFTSRKTQKERDAILRHQLSGFRDAALTRNPTPNSRKLIPRFDGCRRPTIQ